MNEDDKTTEILKLLPLLTPFAQNFNSLKVWDKLENNTNTIFANNKDHNNTNYEPLTKST